MDFISEGMSIAEMVASAAEEVYHSKVPQGFEWIAEYGQYYSKSTGYFYDPSTGLFFHNNTQTYYIFNEETYQYEVYKSLQKLKWDKKRYENRARNLLGENFKHMFQDDVDVCCTLFSGIDKICKQETKELLRLEDKDVAVNALRDLLARKKMSFKGAEMIHTDDPTFVCFQTGNHEKDDGGECSSEEYTTDEENFENDERIQMMEDERYAEAPLLRIIEDQTILHILTIPGGMIGKDPSSAIVLDHPAVPERLLHITFLPEKNVFLLKKLTYLRVLQNDSEIKYNEDQQIEHGDIVYFEGKTLTLHVHYGSNTCSGCEPGLFTPSTSTSITSSIRGETARRKTMKMMKAAYGLNNYDDTRFTGVDRAALRRKYIGSEGPAGKKSSSGVYSGCLARPINNPTTVGYQKPASSNPSKTINSDNKGFKLLKGMGWKEGEGLGKCSTGRIEPVINNVKNDKAGLGATESSLKPKYNSYREAVLDVTRKRYNEIDAEKK